MNTQAPSPLKLRTLDINPKRRVSLVNLPLLLFVALAGEERPHTLVIPGWRVLLSDARDAEPKHSKQCEILEWLKASLEHVDEALRILLEESDLSRLEHEQVELIFIATSHRDDPRARACSPAEERVAEHLAAVPSHQTTPSTDPLVLTLEWVRLWRGIGDRSPHPDVCEQCAYMHAALGDLDPDCPLCEAVQRPPQALTANPMELMRTILRACQPGADLHHMPPP